MLAEALDEEDVGQLRLRGSNRENFGLDCWAVLGLESVGANRDEGHRSLIQEDAEWLEESALGRGRAGVPGDKTPGGCISFRLRNCVTHGGFSSGAGGDRRRGMRFGGECQSLGMGSRQGQGYLGGWGRRGGKKERPQ